MLERTEQLVGVGKSMVAVVWEHHVVGQWMIAIERRGSIERQAGYLNPVQAVAIFLIGCLLIHPSFLRSHQDSLFWFVLN